VRDALGIPDAHETLTDFRERSAAASAPETFPAAGPPSDHDRTERQGRSLTASSEKAHLREDTGAASQAWITDDGARPG
jgi:hypothetical protein